MCFTAIAINKKDKQSLAKACVLSMYINTRTKNKDGAAFRKGNEVIRTLDYPEFFGRLLEMDCTGLTHLHLRAATSAVKQEFVHLWNIGGAYCAHNGILSKDSEDIKQEPIYKYSEYNYWGVDKGYESKHENDKCDSLEFFKSAEKEIRNKDLKGLISKLREWSGYAVLTISYPDNDFIVVSYGKQFVVSLIDEDCLVFSSDEIELSKRINVVRKTEKKYNNFILSKNVTEELILFKQMPEIYSNKYYNVGMLLDENGKIIRKESINSGYEKKVKRIVPMDENYGAL